MIIKMSQWNAEDVFIQLIIEDDISLDEINDAINYLNNNPLLVQSYTKWAKLRDECINKLQSGQTVELITYSVKYKTDEMALQKLKEKILNNEIDLIRRAYRVAYNEGIHADDELWDDR